MIKTIVAGLFTGGVIGAGILTYSLMKPQRIRSYTFNPDRAPAHFSDVDLIEHTLDNPNMKVTEAEIKDLDDQVRRTGKRLGGEDRQKMLAHLSQRKKEWDAVVKKEGITGLLALCGSGPGCWNADTLYGEQFAVCWDCGRRHM